MESEGYSSGVAPVDWRAEAKLSEDWYWCLNKIKTNNPMDVPENSYGYRIYFGKDGERVVIILGGGTKKRQQRDINAAKAYWQDYKARKRKSK